MKRAQIYLLQLGLYVRQRRNFWPQVAANCNEFEVKQRIMEHEHEELVEDEHSKAGHLDLIFRQGKELGLSVDEVLNAEPLPTTKAAIYGWFWIARNRPWQEAIAASTIAEWTNDDRLLGDIGGGNCTRLYKIWSRDLKFTDNQMPNFTAHSKADVKHSDMFIDVLEKYVEAGRGKRCAAHRQGVDGSAPRVLRRHGARDGKRLERCLRRKPMKLEELDSQLEKNQLSGFWRTRVPAHASEAPYLWKWEPLLDGLLKASETIGIDQAERRAIRLVSPHLPIKSTSHTLQFTFSIVNPGEVAKRTATTWRRFALSSKAKGAYTAVDGEKFFMEEGDLILTPNWTWHDHHNESQDPIIWLDGLDGPLIQSLNVLFFRRFRKTRARDHQTNRRILEPHGFCARDPTERVVQARHAVSLLASKDTYKALKAMTDADRDPYDGTLCAISIRPPAATPIRPCHVRFKCSKGRNPQGSSPYQHGALPCLQGQGRTKVGEGYLDWEQGRYFRGAAVAVARP